MSIEDALSVCPDRDVSDSRDSATHLVQRRSGEAGAGGSKSAKEPPAEHPAIRVAGVESGNGSFGRLALKVEVDFETAYGEEALSLPLGCLSVVFCNLDAARDYGGIVSWEDAV